MLVFRLKDRVLFKGDRKRNVVGDLGMLGLADIVGIVADVDIMRLDDSQEVFYSIRIAKHTRWSVESNGMLLISRKQQPR